MEKKALKKDNFKELIEYDLKEKEVAPMEEDLEFPYLYEDKEDYYTNIDYTSDITFGRYMQAWNV